jgi:integrase
MKTRFILFRRGDVFYCEDTTTKKQISLRTRDASEAAVLLNARNESFRQPSLNLQIARTYLAATDPEAAKRTWQVPMDEMTKSKTGSTLVRYQRAMQDQAFDTIRNVPILETHAAQLLKVLGAGSVATNVFLRRIHNFALDVGWLPWPVLAKKRWPKVQFKKKRAIKLDEHQAIVGRERNPERRAFYQLCWHLGAAQSDVANLTADDIDHQKRVVSFRRQKTGTVSIVRFGKELSAHLDLLPAHGPLFPKLQKMRESHRATEFRRCCNRLKIEGVTLHSYRYSWAERARTAGYPERFAMENLGHNSHAVHHAYAFNADVEIPTLEDFEARKASYLAAASA